MTCFHAQQAVEKGLKAYLVARGKALPREHHLINLLQHCVRSKLSGSRGVEHACKILDQYYLPTRYPDALVGSLPQGLPTRSHATEAIDLAETALRAVRRSIRRKSVFPG